MLNFNQRQIMDTIEMIKIHHLDIRTVTLSLSLRDCMTQSSDKTANKIYDKILKYAKNLVPFAQELEQEYSIPIVNKRIALTPISLIGESCQDVDYVKIAKMIDKAADEVGVDFIGGFSALVDKGFTKGDLKFFESIPEAISTTNKLCSSVNLATSKAGINMDAVNLTADVIKKTALLTKDFDSIGAAKFVCFCNAVTDNPFMAGAFCGINEAECALNVGVSGPGVVSSAINKLPKDADFGQVANTIKKMAFKITTTGELIGRKMANKMDIPFGVVDLSLAPTPKIGDSVAEIFNAMGLQYAGCHGTTLALAMLNDAVKKGGIMASSYVGGLSGAFIPVSEDNGMIEAAKNNALTIDKLEAMTSVCSVGLDMIAIPGDTDNSTIAGIIADEMAIGMINKKTTAVRIIPVIGKTAGQSAEFGGLLGSAPIMKVSPYSSYDFVKRGGRVPAPLHSLNN